MISRSRAAQQLDVNGAAMIVDPEWIDRFPLRLLLEGAADEEPRVNLDVLILAAMNATFPHRHHVPPNKRELLAQLQTRPTVGQPCRGHGRTVVSRRGSVGSQ